MAFSFTATLLAAGAFAAIVGYPALLVWFSDRLEDRFGMMRGTFAALVIGLFLPVCIAVGFIVGAKS